MQQNHIDVALVTCNFAMVLNRLDVESNVEIQMLNQLGCSRLPGTLSENIRTRMIALLVATIYVYIKIYNIYIYTSSVCLQTNMQTSK